ncbi:hypothetical protein JRO89_XS08G0163200 [Xanthoceras sorbifolium]|uniref:Homeobox-leucine zipper protein n=1 Tax=Xanthoceras sorbifolium TaxID=99658 RepID=A0ABQ8HQ13_9ROSI|nr:hypothetical protein JRO89_XS08G0163200 [Xanthoceras sorbifolium]
MDRERKRETMTTPIINHQNSDENMVLLSKFYPPEILSQTIHQQQQGEAKPRRRRRRNGKGGGETGRFLGAKKRKLTDEQVTLLEINFGNEHKLETERKDKLALELGLHPRQVAIWFQNRRARYKNKQLEEEYMSLKKTHDSVLLQKCALESEVLRLREKLDEVESEKQRMIQQQLAETDKEIKKLTEGCGENSHNSPSPQFTIESEDTTAHRHGVTDTPFLDEYMPQPPFKFIEDGHHHHPEQPNPTLSENHVVVGEQPRQDGSELTDDHGDGTSYWTGHYRGFMMGYGSLWDDEFLYCV